MTRMTLLSTCIAALIGFAPLAQAQVPPAAPAPVAPAADGAPGQPAAVTPVEAVPAPGAVAPPAAPPVAAPVPAAPVPAAPVPAAVPPLAVPTPPATPVPPAAGTPAVTPAPVAGDAPPAPGIFVPPVIAGLPAPDALAPVPTPAPEAAPPAPILPAAHDLSPMGMYNQADIVVKSVILSLLAASFVTWTVWLFKSIETIVARSRARRAARLLSRAATLESAVHSLQRKRHPAAFMAHAVLEEYRRSDPAIDPAGPEGIKERAASLVSRVEVQAASRMRRGMSLLATIGSVGPFIGLFGTVWGIMNAFIGIAETQTTNLAVVAPGIAEALFATALGLVAAIPAVVIYNIFTRAIASYRQNLGDAGAAVLRLLSRDIDFRYVKEA